MNLHTIGIDLGKKVFHLVGLSHTGEVVVRKKFSRIQLLRLTANVQVHLIGMETCAGSHFLGKALREQAHDMRLMPAQYLFGRGLTSAEHHVLELLQGGIGGNEKDVFLRHHFEDIIGNGVRMLNGIRARFCRDPRGFISDGVRRNLDALIVGFLHNSGHLLAYSAAESFGQVPSTTSCKTQKRVDAFHDLRPVLFAA